MSCGNHLGSASQSNSKFSEESSHRKGEPALRTVSKDIDFVDTPKRVPDEWPDESWAILFVDLHVLKVLAGPL